MCRDCYELDLPEPTVAWADLFKENKDTIKTVGTFVGVPTVLFITITFLNRWMDKNWSSP